MCPNANDERVTNEFNEVVAALGGRPLTVEEFKDKTIRAMRTGVDAAAMEFAYDFWDLNNGNPMHKTPNGAESILFKSLEEHYGDRQKAIRAKANTFSKAFKNWFGDWTTEDKTNVSKVVDENGEPLVVYHQSNASGFAIFNLDKSTKDRDRLNSYSFHFGTRKAAEEVETLGERGELFSVFLNIKTPVKLYDDVQASAYSTLLNFYDSRAIEKYGKKLSETLFNKARSVITDYDASPEEKRKIMAEVFDYMGFDGVFYENRVEDAGSTSYAVLKPNQIKHINNNGNFSTVDDNIYHKLRSENKTESGISIYQLFGTNEIETTSIDLLSKIESYVSTEYKSLFDLLKQFPINVRIKNDLSGQYMYYDANEDCIYINQLEFDTESIQYNSVSILHEIVHAFTERALSSATTPEEIQLKERIESLLEFYRNLYKEEVDTEGKFHKELYGLNNAHEFVAELLTNREFVQNVLLDSEQRNKANTFAKLLSSLWNAVKNLFRSKAKQTRKLTEKEIKGLEDQVMKVITFDIQERTSGREVIRNSAKQLIRQRESFSEHRFDTEEQLNKKLKKLRKDLTERLQSRLKSVDEKDPVRANELREQIKYQIKNLQNEILSDINIIVDFTQDLKLDLLPIAKQVIDAYNNRIDPLTDEKLVSLNKNYFGMYCWYAKEAYESIADLAQYRDIIGDQTYDKLRTDLEICKNLLDRCAHHVKLMQVERAKQILLETGESVNSPTIYAYLQENSDETSFDIGSLTRMFVSGDKIADEAIKGMFHIMQQTENSINEATFEVANKLLRLAKEAGNRQKMLFEVDDEGNTTGYIVRSLNYGKFYKNYKKEMERIRKELGLSPKEIALPENRELRIQYQKMRNEWLSKHCERRYTQQYYEYMYALSDETTKARESVQSKIRDLCDKYRDIDGIVQFEKFSDEEYQRLEQLYLEKKQLASKYDIYGVEKPLGSVERQIADELTELNEKLAKGLKMKSNMTKFEEVRALKEKELSSKDYQKWLDRNTRVVYSQEWYDLLAKIDRVEYGDAYALLNEQKREILKLFRDDKTGEINTRLMPNSTKNLINRLDARMRVIRKSKKRKSGASGISFDDIAMIVPTEQYKKDRAKAAEAEVDNPGSLEEFELAHTYRGADGRVYPKSYYTKIVPKDSKYITREPSSNFSELSENSPFFNKNFDPNEGEYYQPKRSLYDNSKAYKEIKNNAKLSALRDALIQILDESNEKLDNRMGLNKYKLPQISGSFYKYLVAYKWNPFKAIKNYLLDRVSVLNDDVGYGDKVKSAPDGTSLHMIPQYFLQDLDNPATISADMVGSVIQYFRMAENFKQKSEIRGKLENIKAFLFNRQFVPGKSVTDSALKFAGLARDKKEGSETNIYKFAEKFLNMNLYGVQKNNMTISIGDRKVNFAKLISILTGYGTLRNLGLNLISATTGFFTALHSHLVKILVGRYYDFHDAVSGFKDLVWDVLRYGINAGCKTYKSQQMAAMDYFGVGSTMDSIYQDSNRPRIVNIISRHWAFGIYSLSDYLVKGTILNAAMYNYRNVNGEFLSKEEYFSKYGKTEESKVNWRKAKSFKASVKFIDGKLIARDIKDQKAVNKIKHTIGDIARYLAASADGQLTPLQKAQFTTNVFGAACMMHRNYLPVILTETFTMKRQWDYNSKREVEATVLSLFRLFAKAYKDRNIKDLLSQLIFNNKMEDELTRTNIKRLKIEIPMILFLWPFIATQAKEWADKDRRNILKQLIAFSLLRTSFETKNLYNIVDMWNNIKTPTPLFDLIDTFSNSVVGYPIDLLFGLFDNEVEGNKIITRGAYRGWTQEEKNIMKSTPFKNVYELNDIPSKYRYYETQIMK